MATRTISNAGGNFNATATWVEGVVPTSADDVVATSTSGPLTINVASTVHSFDLLGYTSTLTYSQALTVAAGSTAPPSGWIFRLSSTTTWTSTVSVALTITAASGAGTCKFTTGGASGPTVDEGVSLSGVGSSYLQTDDCKLGSTRTFTFSSGTYDTGGFALTTGGFAVTGTATKVLTLGASSILINGNQAWNVNGTGTTINAGTSTITNSGTGSFTGGGMTYATVQFTAAGQALIADGGNTFANLTRTGTAVKTDALQLGGNQSVTGTFTVNGNSAINRVLVYSTTVGATRTITAAAVSASNVDFQDITGAGAATWNLAAITGNSGDCGGNTGITFTTSVSQTMSGSISTNIVWSTYAWPTRVPLPQDDVTVTATFASGVTPSWDMPRLGRTIDFSGMSWSGSAPTINFANPVTIYGSLTWKSGLLTQNTQALTFAGRGSYSFTSAGVGLGVVNFNAPGGTYSLLDALHVTALTLNCGTLDTSAAGTVAISSTLGFSSPGSVARSLVMGTSTWNFTSTGSFWTVSGSNVTVSAASSTIAITLASTSARTFAGGGFTYGTLTYTVAGSTGGLTITGNNTFDTLNFSDANNGRTLTITSGSTQTVTNWNVNGQNALGMTISPSSTTNYTLKGNGKNWRSTYITISRCTFTATAGELFFAGGATSVDGGNNTGVRFDTPSDLATTQPGVARVAQNLTNAQTAVARITSGGVAVDAVSTSATTTGVSSKTWTHVVGTGTNRLLTVTVGWTQPNNVEVVSSVAYGGTALASAGAAQISPDTGGINRCVQMFYLVAPPSGSASIVVTMSGVCTFGGAGVSFTGVSQSTPLGTVGGTNSGAATTLGVTTTSGTSDMVLSALCVRTTSTVTTPATQQSNQLIGTNLKLATAAQAGAASVTSTYSWTTADQAAEYAVDVKAPVVQTTKTQAATARIAANSTSAQTATARVAAIVTKGQTAASRIAVVVTKSQGSAARVALNKTLVQTSITRIAINRTSAQSATSRVAVTATRTQTSLARVAVVTTKSQSATANIASTAAGTKAQTATARIALNRSASQTSLSRIALTPTLSQSARARVALARSVAQSATAHVVVSVTRTATQTTTSRIAMSRTVTQTATARAALNGLLAQSSTATVAVRGVLMQSSAARLAGAVARAQSATATISFVPPGTGAGATATMRPLANLVSSVAPTSVLTVGVTTP